MHQVDQIRVNLKAMPPLPDVAQRLLVMLNDPDYAIDAVVDLVRLDPTLTARLLRLVNSAMFGNARSIMTVPDAIAYAGTRNLVKIVLVSCTAAQFAATPASRYADPGALWHHTLGCAFTSQHLAARVALDPSLAFTAGVLHNVGKIAMARSGNAWRPELADTVDGAVHDLCALERECFGIDHAQAAAVVATAWQLPPELAQPLAAHHDAEPTDPLAAVLDLADTVTLAAGIGNPVAPRCPAPRPASLQLLELDDSDLQTATAHLMAEMQRSGELLNLDSFVGR